MDPNLHFRFSIPGWVLALTAVTVAWARGMFEWTEVAGCFGQLGVGAAILGFAAAFLGAPAIGFLLNTVVIFFCDLFGVGPLHTQAFRQFYDRLFAPDIQPHDPTPESIIAELKARIHGTDLKTDAATPSRPGLWRRILMAFRREHILAAFVAHFEYRVDPKELLEWRRRQRTAFFGNWANALAIALGIVIGYVCNLESSESLRQWIVCPLAVILIGMFILVAKRSTEVADQQQMMWAKSWDRADIVEFLTEYGTGYKTYIKEVSKESASDTDSRDDPPDNDRPKGKSRKRTR